MTALAVLLLTVLCLAAGFCFSAKTASADAYSPLKYSFYFESYDVTYDIKSNREISVTEVLETTFTGYDSTGFIKSIPVNAGELVKNVKVTELFGGTEKSVNFDVSSSSDDGGNDCILVDIGDYSRKTNQTHTYKVTYTYCLTKAQEGKDVLYLNAIGVDRESFCNIVSANVTLILPDGYLNGQCLTGKVLSENEEHFNTSVDSNGRTVLSVSDLALEYDEGITFRLNFNEGALSTYFDFTPFYFVIVGAALLIILILLKLFCFNKQSLTPVVNFEAPNKMDPLMMGKLIDNKIDSEDITSMIYYWADKGYIKINLDNQTDPTLIRIVRNLPEGTPAYEVVMFNEMFKGYDVIQPSSLKYSFYKTIDRVSLMVNGQTKNLYNRNSTWLALIFTVLAGLILGLAPLLLAITQISFTYLVIAPFISIVPMIFLYVFGLGIKYNSLKSNKGLKIGMAAAMAVISAVFVLAYTFFVPSHILGIIPKIILSVISCVTAAASSLIISRTKEYTEQLNEIVGFRNFITLAEKDRLEKMLEDDPEFYFHILPYAQVLGVSDKWEEKFKEITVQPPQWATSSSGVFVNFYVFNSIMRTSMSSMRSNMVSRPSSSGSSGVGGFSGGHGGGHVGGGHGGGGFRGR